MRFSLSDSFHFHCLVNPFINFYVCVHIYINSLYIYIRVCVHLNSKMGSQISVAYNKELCWNMALWGLASICSHVTNLTEPHLAHTSSPSRTCSECHCLQHAVLTWQRAETQGQGQSQTTKTLYGWWCTWCPFTFYLPKQVAWPNLKSLGQQLPDIW